jgi:hypothetical protein
VGSVEKIYRGNNRQTRKKTILLFINSPFVKRLQNVSILRRLLFKRRFRL